MFNSELNSRRRSRKESNAGGRHQQELPLPFPDKHSSLEFAMQIQDSPSPITKYQLRKLGFRWVWRRKNRLIGIVSSTKWNQNSIYVIQFERVHFGDLQRNTILVDYISSISFFLSSKKLSKLKCRKKFTPSDPFHIKFCELPSLVHNHLICRL